MVMVNGRKVFIIRIRFGKKSPIGGLYRIFERIAEMLKELAQLLMIQKLSSKFVIVRQHFFNER